MILMVFITINFKKKKYYCQIPEEETQISVKHEINRKRLKFIDYDMPMAYRIWGQGGEFIQKPVVKK